MSLKDEFRMQMPRALSNGRATRVAVLTGAGISAESGLATFRGEGGLWEGHSVMQVATPEAFERNPEMVWRFYAMRRAALREVCPNPAHLALTKLEAYLEPGCFSLITQNVDDLHQRAGSQAVYAMHGELRKIRCCECGVITVDDRHFDEIPYCDCGGMLRPHVVWFGEIPFFIGEIDGILRGADVFISIGTSGSVFPAAGFVAAAKSAGALSVWANIDDPPGVHLWDEFYRGPAAEVLPQLVGAWIGEDS